MGQTLGWASSSPPLPGFQDQSKGTRKLLGTRGGWWSWSSGVPLVGESHCCQWAIAGGGTSLGEGAPWCLGWGPTQAGPGLEGRARIV